MHWYDREPRVVLKDTLAWDPAIDVLLHRIPARFISPNPNEGAGSRTRSPSWPRGLDENDAFVIFPEGGNFTAGAPRARRSSGCASSGMERMARRAERMTHVLAPRPGGLLAALDAAPDADVVLVAHTGLDHLLTVGDIWRELPMDKRDHDAVVAGATRRDPGRARGADRLALRLVGADRRVDRRAPAEDLARRRRGAYAGGAASAGQR